MFLKITTLASLFFSRDCLPPLPFSLPSTTSSHRPDLLAIVFLCSLRDGEILSLLGGDGKLLGGGLAHGD